MEGRDVNSDGGRMHRAVTTFVLGALVAGLAQASARADSGGAFTGCDGAGCGAEAFVDRRESNGGGGADSKPEMSCTYREIEMRAGDKVYDADTFKAIEVDGTGKWYERRCEANGQEVMRDSVYLRPANPAELRAEARERLVFPRLRLRFNPENEAYVNDPPTWLWIDSSQWTPITATAAVPGVSVTVVATPIRVTWSMGDGSEPLVCNGPGQPFDPRRPAKEQQTDCSHVFKRASYGAPGGVFKVKATVQWQVAWSVSGAVGGGQLDGHGQESEEFPLRVVEVGGLTQRK